MTIPAAIAANKYVRLFTSCLSIFYLELHGVFCVIVTQIIQYNSFIIHIYMIHNSFCNIFLTLCSPNSFNIVLC